MYGISSYIDDKFVPFAEGLPHGSGIDSDWNARETKQYVYFENGFHCMDEWGSYNGWQDFSVRVDRVLFEHWLIASDKAEKYHADYKRKMIDRVNALIDLIAENFTLQFNNGHYLANKHMLRGYLEDTIFCSISEMKIN